jgi:hypothetical protein
MTLRRDDASTRFLTGREARTYTRHGTGRRTPESGAEPASEPVSEPALGIATGSEIVRRSALDNDRHRAE